MQDAFSTADLALARRVEATEAANGFAIARAIAEASPDLKAAAEPFLGGAAVFGGVGSPMTHALGIGMCGPIDEAEFDRMEAFFRDRGSPVLIDLCPMADGGLIHNIVERGYRVIEFNNVMVRRIAPGEQIVLPATDVQLAGVAAFYGDSTVLRARRQGVQFATLQARLRDAAAAGCDLAMACVLPGSGSHRNYEKAGFRLFFMRVNLILP